MKITYDKVRDVAYLQFLEMEKEAGVVSRTEEIADGVFVDYTTEGRVFGIEILDMSERISAEELVAGRKLKARAG